MMTKIEEDNVFVHTSDIQLLNNESISHKGLLPKM